MLKLFILFVLLGSVDSRHQHAGDVGERVEELLGDSQVRKHLLRDPGVNAIKRFSFDTNAAAK
jgi:hypothetical protein